MMKEKIKQHSKAIGIILGLVNGIAQGAQLPHEPMFPAYSQDALWTTAIFGILVPPVLTILNNRITPFFGEKMFRNINSYVNLFYLMISFGLSTGLVGVIVYLISHGERAALIPIAFFGCGGIGFLVAYFMDTTIGYRYEKMPNKAL